MYRGLQLAVAAGVGGSSARVHRVLQISMDVEFAQLSDVGRIREANEDYLGCVAPGTPEEARARGWFFALADGVGGHDHGELASRAAIENLIVGFRESAPEEPHLGMLTRVIQAANASVLEAARAVGSSGGPPMATTIVTCALRYDRASIAHVGDSRCYLIRRGRAVLLTRDHTLANEHVRLRIISRDEAANAETRHMLSRSLGGELVANIEVSEHQVFVGDVLLLCSDGLHGPVTASEMAAIAGQGGDLTVAAKRLVDIANQRDGSDNISLQLIRVRSVERVGMYRGRPYRLP